NPPFDNPDMRKAMSLALDRKPFNSILMEGQGLLGGAMLPKPVGEWGMPPEMVSQLTGYGPDSEKNIADAQAIMQKLGYGEAKPPSDQAPAPKPADLSRSRRHRHRPAQEDLYQRRARHPGHAALVRAAAEEGLHDRPQRHRRVGRRSRRQYRRELFLQVRAQL